MPYGMVAGIIRNEKVFVTNNLKAKAKDVHLKLALVE